MTWQSRHDDEKEPSMEDGQDLETKTQEQMQQVQTAQNCHAKSSSESRQAMFVVSSVSTMLAWGADF